MNVRAVSERTDDTQSARWTAAEEGMELVREGELEAAIAELRAVIERDEDNEYAHFFLGHAYFEQHAFDKALKCYVRAIELQPDYVGAMIGAGHCLRMVGDHSRALRMAREVLRRQPEDGEAFYLMGIVHFQVGNWNDAEALLRRFLDSGPELEVALEVEAMLEQIRDRRAPN